MDLTTADRKLFQSSACRQAGVKMTQDPSAAHGSLVDDPRVPAQTCAPALAFRDRSIHLRKLVTLV